MRVRTLETRVQIPTDTKMLGVISFHLSKSGGQSYALPVFVGGSRYLVE